MTRFFIAINNIQFVYGYVCNIRFELNILIIWRWPVVRQQQKKGCNGRPRVPKRSTDALLHKSYVLHYCIYILFVVVMMIKTEGNGSNWMTKKWMKGKRHALTHTHGCKGWTANGNRTKVKIGWHQLKWPMRTFFTQHIERMNQWTRRDWPVQ